MEQTSENRLQSCHCQNGQELSLLGHDFEDTGKSWFRKLFSWQSYCIVKCALGFFTSFSHWKFAQSGAKLLIKCFANQITSHWPKCIINHGNFQCGQKMTFNGPWHFTPVSLNWNMQIMSTSKKKALHK